MKKLLLFVFCAMICTMICAGLYAQGIDRDIEVAVDGGTLYGSMLVPESAAPVPVVLFIAGSGPTDRDGNQSAIKNNSTKMMAQALYDAGIASVRYDKRLTLNPESELRFEHYVDDASAWVDLIAQNDAFSDIIIIGHSEGATIGALAAIKNPKVKRVVYLCGTTEGIATTMKRQLDNQPAGFDPYRKISNEIIDSLVQGHTVTNVPQELYSLFRPSVQPYMISWMKYVPEEYMAEVSVPVLIIHGTTDIQVPPAGQKELAAVNPKARAVTVTDMNHVLKRTASTDMGEQMKVYTNPTIPLHEELMPLVIGFIKE